MAKRTDIERWQRPASVHYPAKVALPARQPAILHRQRLTDLLAEHTSRRLTIVSAPAGYGKTTLLPGFGQTWQDPICWYSLDERDRDLPTFLGYWLPPRRATSPSFLSAGWGGSGPSPR